MAEPEKAPEMNIAGLLVQYFEFEAAPPVTGYLLSPVPFEEGRPRPGVRATIVRILASGDMDVVRRPVMWRRDEKRMLGLDERSWDFHPMLPPDLASRIADAAERLGEMKAQLADRDSQVDMLKARVDALEKAKK